MRVLISLTYYLPNISGLTLYAATLAQELAKKGYQVSVLTAQYKSTLATNEDDQGVTIHRVPVSLQFGKAVVMLQFPFKALTLVAQAEIVNCHLPQFEAVILAVLAKCMGKRLILTHHTDLSWWPGLTNKIAVMAMFLSQLISGFLADCIVVYSQDYAQHSYYLRFFTRKLVVCYPPIKLNGQVKPLAIPDVPKVVIGFAGRIARQKGIPYLLDAIPYLKKGLGESFRIVFAGPEKEVIGEDYKHEIAPLLKRYKDVTVFLGKIAPEQMSTFYQALAVLVLPSDDRLESLGFVQVEAMLSGIPVVVTDLPGVRVPVEKTGMGIVVPPQDSRALAEAILEVVNHPARYIKPKKVIEKEFDYERTIATYDELFRQRN